MADNESDYEHSDEENEEDEEDELDEDDDEDYEYYTPDGVPVIDDEFYSRFLDDFVKEVSDEKLTGLVKRIREENPNFLKNAVAWSEHFPGEYQDRIVLGQLLGYEMIRQRGIELDKIIEAIEQEQEEDGRFRFKRYKNCAN